MRNLLGLTLSVLALFSSSRLLAQSAISLEMVDLFEYDATGNWINRVNFMRRNPVMIVGREKAYYE